jgi:hypothetical protein
VKRISLRIVITRRENEPERNVLSNIIYVCLSHVEILVPWQVGARCDGYGICVNVTVFCRDACVVKKMGELTNQCDVQVSHKVNVEVRKKNCVKLMVNFREYTINQGRHRIKSSHSRRPVEVVLMYILILQ